MCGRVHHGFRGRVTDVDDAEEIQARRERSVMRHASKMGTIVVVCLAIWLVTGAVHAEPEYADY